MIKGLSNTLAEYGYNLVALPKAGIEPLSLLFKQNGSLGQVGALVTKLFDKDGAGVPEVSENVKVVDISDSISLMFDAKAGARLMGGLLQLPQGSSVNTHVALNTNDKVLVNYQHIREDRVSLLDLDNFLHRSLPKADSFRTFQQKLYDSELYVISAVLKSNRFTVTIANERAQQAGVEVKVPQAAEVSADVSSNKVENALLQYDGDTDLIFAFKAQRVIYDHKRWWEFWEKGPAGFRIKNVTGETLKGTERFPTFPLEPGEEPVDI